MKQGMPESNYFEFQAKNAEEKTKKAMVDAARLADELRSEQDHSSAEDKARRALESQVGELEQRLYDAGEAAARGTEMNMTMGAKMCFGFLFTNSETENENLGQSKHFCAECIHLFVSVLSRRR